jgi:hypothetical protein
MRELAFSACLLLALPIAAPAGAQIAGRHDYGPVTPPTPFLGDSRLPGPGTDREVEHVRDRVHRARESGLISRGEARRLNREARAIERLAEVYGRDGLSQSEQRELDARTAILRDALYRAR